MAIGSGSHGPRYSSRRRAIVARPVQRQTGHDRREVGRRALDAVVVDALPADPGLLHDVLGIAVAGQDAIGQAEEAGPLGGEVLVRTCHRPTMPPIGDATLFARSAAARPAASPLERAASASSPTGPTQSPARNTPGRWVASMPGRPARPAPGRGRRVAHRHLVEESLDHHVPFGDAAALGERPELSPVLSRRPCSVAHDVHECPAGGRKARALGLWVER